VNAPCLVLARLMLDPRAPDASGARLIEWAVACQASGVIVPRAAEASLAAKLGALADGKGLRWYRDGDVPAGYTDELPELAPALAAAACGASIVVKGLTMNRSLGGPAHAGSLDPDEFAALVRYIRTAGRPVVARVVEPLAHTGSFVAAKSLAMGQTLTAGDVTVVPELCGVTAALASRVIGSRLRDARVPGEPITFGVLEPWAVEPLHSGDRLDLSIVIRAKSEADWLARSLPAIWHQRRPPREIIVIDNDSTDGTATVAARFGCRVEPMPDAQFKFGRALNRGIELAEAPWVVSISAHCIPVHDRWLDAFAARTDDPFMAGAYGRQEPLPSSTDFDKRDLWTTFGEEQRRQRGRDYFFHNANSLIQRAAWARIPFDDVINGVEDRDWARRALADGYVIEYAPLASVHHWHGIHQGRDEQRATRVARVIEFIQGRPAAVAAAVEQEG